VPLALPVAAPSTRPARRWPLRIVAALLLVAGLAAVAGGIAGLVSVADRQPTQAQITAAAQRELALQWRRETAGQLFPATVQYTTVTGVQATATRVGIAQETPCAIALAPKAAQLLARTGCVTVLRATYADDLGTAVTTVGIAVLRDASSAAAAYTALQAVPQLIGLMPVSFPGTVSSEFSEESVQANGERALNGPYLALYVTGYSDGRATNQDQLPAGDVDGYTAQVDLGTGVMGQLAESFLRLPYGCADRNVQC
jgi:hypothetical protein